VKGLPGNPRKGDVEAVARSLAQFGQRKPIVARRMKRSKDGHPTGEVIAGNHTLQAALTLGWEQIAVTWTDDDAKTAKAYALADNKTHDIGGYDDALLGEMLADLQGADDLLAATGYDEDEIASLLAALPSVDDDPADDPTPEGPTGMGNPVIAYQIVFDTEAQQQAWYGFMRWLRAQYPDLATNAERIVAYLQGVVDEPA
jgi:hypothetical protein